MRHHPYRFIFLITIPVAFVFFTIVLRWNHNRPLSPENTSPRHPVFSATTPKPEPKEITFRGCPPEGAGKDAGLNLLKNRVDEAEYIEIPFDSIIRLRWPAGVERRRRSVWSESDRSEVSQIEGIPVMLEGYLAGVREEGKESPNCYREEHVFRDYHIWLVRDPDGTREKSIVVEATPRVRINHPGWSLGRIRKLVHEWVRVRIGGWLMLDPEHPDQVGKTRGTIWEIHPVMKILVRHGESWISLDSLP